MRRICAIFAGVLLLLGLAACGGGEGTSSLGTLAESALSQLEETESELEVLTVEETVERFRTLSPGVLGIEGDSLDKYDVFYKPGNVYVDGLPCLEITVYTDSEVETNVPLGTYLFARDGSVLYKLDVDTDTIKKLEI